MEVLYAVVQTCAIISSQILVCVTCKWYFCVMSPFSSLSFKYLNFGLMVLFAFLQLFSYQTRFLLFTYVTNCTNDSVPKYLVCDADRLGIIFADFVFSSYFVMAFIPPIIFFLVGFSSHMKIFLFYLHYIFPHCCPLIWIVKRIEFPLYTNIFLHVVKDKYSRYT